MSSTRDAQGYPLQGIDVAPERPPQPQNPPLPDLVRLFQEARQREEAAHRRAEHWHHAYQLIRMIHLACQEPNTPASDSFELCPACSSGCRPSLGTGNQKPTPTDIKKKNLTTSCREWRKGGVHPGFLFLGKT